jgi:hypothetical protein
MGTVEKLIKYAYVISSTSFVGSRMLRARAAIRGIAIPLLFCSYLEPGI